MQQLEPHERNPYAPKFEDRTLQETLQHKEAPAENHGTW